MILDVLLTVCIVSIAAMVLGMVVSELNGGTPLMDADSWPMIIIAAVLVGLSTPAIIVIPIWYELKEADMLRPVVVGAFGVVLGGVSYALGVPEPLNYGVAVLWCISYALGMALFRRAQRRYEAWERAYRLAHSEQVRAAAENIYQVTRAMFRVTRDGGAGR